MEEKFFYKVKNTENDKYNIYICADDPCGEIIKWAIDDYHEDNEEGKSIMFFIEKYMKEYEISYLKIDYWNEIEY